MRTLKVLDLPLYGTRLIEASAGTGKTYVLGILYLRLLLHLGEASAFCRPLTIQEILVVTFTNTAVQSLRNRIRENIKQFRLDCIRGYSNNYLFSKLLIQIHDIDRAIYQLLEAEKQINEASIFTIHGFCHKILTQHTIESNMLFNISITNNEIVLYKQVCADFWRKYFYPLPLNIISLVQEYWPNLDCFLKEIFPYIHKKSTCIKKSTHHTNHKNIYTYYNKIIINIKNVKKIWNLKKNFIIYIVNAYDINRRIYNTKNVKKWINNISFWAQQPTIDHVIPNELKYFKTSVLQIHNNNICKNFIFNEIEKLYAQLFTFKFSILNIAIYAIQQDLKKIEYSELKITINDLISLLEYNLIQDKTKKLACTIRTCYPIAIIDEFQDTNRKQNNIFRMLYFNYSKNGLILIGDPKQAIYSFQGADIFTYIQTRRTIPARYTLNVNWRSSSNMINAVNQLFQYTANPFIFKDIPFFPSIPAPHGHTYRFFINNKLQQAMCFWLPPQKILTIREYKNIMAQECAITIRNLLYAMHKKTTWIEYKHYKKILQPSDITILVRNHEEALLMRKNLSIFDISTIFLSNKENVFNTTESYDLSLLLQAIFFLNKTTICTALTTIFFGLNAKKIEHINNNEYQWEKIINEFSQYSVIWKKYGIYSMIYKIIFKYKIPEMLLNLQGGEQKLINILHLGELLQNISIQLPNEYELIQWLLHNITQSNDEYISSENLLRLNDNHQLIKISTIHKSKGLEFPLTFLPFIANIHYKYKNPLLHKNWKSYITNLNKSILHNTSIIDKENYLSEDLRLLYVAVTRSIYHCSIGIAPIIYKSQKKSDIHDLHRCAIGYLIQQNTSGNSEFLKKNLQILSTRAHGDISIRYITKNKKIDVSSKPIISLKKNFLHTQSLKIPTTIVPWVITSFSQLKCINTSSTHCNIYAQLNINEHTDDKNCNIHTPHTFPKGKICGNFFHKVLKNLDFTKSIDQTWLHTQIDKYNFNVSWSATIQQWIYNIINTPLNHEDLTLSKIHPTNKQTELKFYLPIDTYLTSEKLNFLCKNYDFLSSQSPQLNFSKTTGMLTGFIDLIFYWNKKYYLLDYKTNWIGENNNAYTNSNIQKEIINKCYTLQYQLYTLALHRFLQYRISSYNYKKNFGGIYYLFIRGMDGTKSSKGIYFIQPLSSIFIKKLDNLFLGK